MIVEHTNGGYSNTHGNSHYFIQAHFIPTLMCFHDHSSVSVTRTTRTALMNGDHPLTVQKLANVYVKISAAEQKPCRSSRVTARGFQLRQTRTLEVFLDDQMDPYQARGKRTAYLFPEYRVPLIVYVIIRGPRGLIIDILHHWASQYIGRITFTTGYLAMTHTMVTSCGNLLPAYTVPKCRMIEEVKRIWMDAVLA